ncbi:D-cysteine desulfhydrase family protein [Aquimarina aquimarini]|uniref:D-cysteine desulfhydrase family protein n=1 Tax=Aquimarina aquimarini TaxID=1191734 RepID=UPI000D55E1A7|nr:D-cysteine desulfhydrase family protein [Aquimarina aquimarini]
MKNILENTFDLGFFPTPLHYLPRLTNEFPDYKIYIKRDDHTGLATGGNKTRKLEYLLQDAIDQGCDTIITAGAQQSNHCRQTAAACAIAGLNCHLLLGGIEPKQYDGNLLLSKTLGASIHFTGDNRKGEDIHKIQSELSSKNKKCYVIPYGGSNSIGAMGFVVAIKELKEQLIALNQHIDYIFFASSSGGMQAGLTLGIDLYDLNTKLMPISIDKAFTKDQVLEKIIFDIITEGKQKLGITKPLHQNDISLIKGYDNQGYGVFTDNEKMAISTLAKHEGILLDPVYTGRAFYAMLDHLKQKKIPQSNVLFWHTGGIPANFHYAKESI